VQPDEPEPPFYRVHDRGLPDHPDFRQIIATQFLGSTRSKPLEWKAHRPTPMAPPSTYDSHISGRDGVVSKLLGVTILTQWTESGAKAKSYRSYTQIADSMTAQQSISADGRAVALRISSVVQTSTGPVRLNLEAGVLDTKGSTYTGSTAGLSITGAFAELGEIRAVGRSVASGAPPAVNNASLSAGQAGGIGGGCQFACFGASTAANLQASTASGLPVVASTASPLTTTLVAGTVGAEAVSGFRYSNGPDASTITRLSLTGPVVQSTIVAADGTFASATGHLSSTSAPRSVVSSASVKTGTISVLPTSFAPGGVVRVSLSGATVSCTTATTSGTPSSTLAAPAPSVSVEYLPAGSSSYVALSPTAVLASLAVGPLTGSTLRLSDYLASNPSGGTGSTAVQDAGRRGEATLPAALRLITAPLRSTALGTPDTDSGVTVELGSLSCATEDRR
jgi:hypothetical protein